MPVETGIQVVNCPCSISVVKRLVASKPRLDSGVRRNDGQGEISSIYCAGLQSAITPP